MNKLAGGENFLTNFHISYMITGFYAIMGLTSDKRVFLIRLLNPWKHLSLHNKLFVLLVIFSVLPSLLVYWSSQYFMVESNMKHSAASASLLLKSAEGELSHVFGEYSTSINALVVNYDFQQYLKAEPTDYALQSRLASGFKSLLQNMLQLHPELAGILYTDNLGKVYYASNQYFRDFNYPIAASRYYSEAAVRQAPYLSVPHDADYMLNTPVEVFSFVFPVRDLRSGSYDARIYLEINAEAIRSKLADEISADAHLSLYDAETGTMVTAGHSNRSFAQALAQALAAPQGKQSFKADTEEYEYASLPLGLGQWELVWSASLREISGGVRQSLGTMLLIAAASVAVALIIAYPAMRILWRPMRRLSSSIGQLSRGRYEPVDSTRSDDEIGRLIAAFNTMLVNLQQLEQEVLESRLKEQEQELLYLQAQTNPHLLFNTLEMIDSYAARGDSEAVGEMIQSVSRMMRYSVSKDGGWVTLEEELAYTEEFLRIHSYRFGGGTSLRWNIDPLCLKRKVMKLCVQPFVENILKYGGTAGEPQQKLEIEISAQLDGGFFRLSVADSGSGTDAEVMAKVNRLSKEQGKSGDPFFLSHTGILNICRRLHLAYGSKVTVRMQPNHPRGTVIGWSLQPDSNPAPGWQRGDSSYRRELNHGISFDKH